MIKFHVSMAFYGVDINSAVGKATKKKGGEDSGEFRINWAISRYIRLSGYANVCIIVSRTWRNWKESDRKPKTSI